MSTHNMALFSALKGLLVGPYLPIRLVRAQVICYFYTSIAFTIGLRKNSSFFFLEVYSSLRVMSASDTDHITLSRYTVAEAKDPNLAVLMAAIQMACKVIASAVRKAGMRKHVFFFP